MINRYSMLSFIMLLFVSLLFIQSNVFAQGVTSAAMNGVIKDSKGDALPGANILAVHTPSGTQYGTTSRVDGKYNFNGLRTGGPYTVTVSFVGYKPQAIDGINLLLGQNLRQDYTLLEEAVELGSVTIVGERSNILNSGKTGAVTSVTTEQIQSLPTINRSFQDFSKLSPLFSGSSLSAGGRNFKLNNIQVDGTQYNDLFGLGSTGTPGGQANANPISLDAIEEFQVVIAPYDVRLGGFTGGGVNAITRSGDNKLSGSVYGYGRNQDLVGKSPDLLKTKLSEFSEYQAGLRLGGPIMKDKLFFFVNAEMTQRKEPSENTKLIAKSKLDTASTLFYNVLVDSFGYNPGTLGDVTRERPSLKLFARIDWNIGENHTLTLRNNYVDADDDILPRSSLVQFSDRLYTISNMTNSSVLQLNSRFGNNMSNELIVGYTMIRDKRSVGSSFPAIRINDPSLAAEMWAGTEEFSIANSLDQDIIEFTDNFSIYAGNHVLTIGTHNELFSFNNLFIRNFNGLYTFTSVANLAAKSPSRYNYRYSLTDDPRQAAEFSAIQLGGYLQDEWSLAPNFKLTIGVRLDVPLFPDKPAVNDSVNKFFGSLGYGTDIVPSGNLLISPRVGFNWDVVGDKSSILRGGVGIFTGRVPYVWISNQYSNTGVEFADIDRSSPGFFVSDPDSQPKVGQNGLTALSTEINITDPDFKLPQVLRANLGLDQKLPLNLVGSFDFLYTKSINDPVYRDLNITSQRDTLADGRFWYSNARVSSYFTRVMLLENTSDNYSTSVSAQVQGEPIKDIYLNLGYSGSITKDKNSVVSSQAQSQFRFNPIPNTPNDPPLTRSSFEVSKRFFGSLSFSHEFFAQAKTTLTIFYNYQSGRPFSYSFNGDVNQDGHDQNDLIYIPSSVTDAQAKYDFGSVSNNVFTPQPGQADLLMAYINHDDYLKNNKGKIAVRNGATEPWFDQIDLRLSQEIPFFFGHEFELSFDILNFGNLLNSEWGWLQQVPNQSDLLLRLLTTNTNRTGFDPANGKIRIQYVDKTNPYVNNSLLSRWQMQLGLRYSF